METILPTYLSSAMLFITDEDPFLLLFRFLAAAALIFALIVLCFRSNPIYLVDFSCYMPPDSLRVPISNYIEHFQDGDIFDKASIDLQIKVLERAGIGPEACMPVAVHVLPPDAALTNATAEVETVLFTVVQDLLTKHNISPKDIDILISNCSLFCPLPSITSMIINKFRFRSNIKSISLSGMGCSAGMLSVSLAKDLLRVHKNSTALVLSMEAVTPNGYTGNVKSMLVTNLLFRMGGAAMLISNRKEDKKTAKYKLKNLVRTHLGSNDQAYQSVFQQHDEGGKRGVSLSRALLPVAAKALTTNMSALGPLTLPFSEQLRYGCSLVSRKIWPPARKELYVPNFKKAFEHFCIHAGGKAVIDAVEESLRLQKEDTEASKMTLYRFGNTSSSSLWYELCYLETKGKVKKGDRVWQIAFGSGFKCNSAVWQCISNIDPNARSAWSDRIHLYPVDIPTILFW